MANYKVVDVDQLEAGLTDICDTIRKYTDDGELAFPNDMKNAIDAVAENQLNAGKQAEYDEFWDTFQNKGKRGRYLMAFADWKAANFRPKYDLVPTNAHMMFYSFQDKGINDLKGILESLGIKLDFSKCTNFTQCFAFAYIHYLGVIDTRGATSLSSILYDASHIKSVDKLILKEDGSQKFTSAFGNASGLYNMPIEGVIGKNGFNVQWSTKLNHDSLLSILNALQDKTTDTSGTVWEVTIGATNKAKLTEDELKIAQNKGWVVS